MTNKSRQKLKYLVRTKRVFEVKQKAFFINFKELSISKKCLRPESVSLIDSHNKIISSSVIDVNISQCEDLLLHFKVNNNKIPYILPLLDRYKHERDFS